MTVTTRDARSYTSTVYAPRGSAIVGIDWRDVEAKYRALVPYARLTGENLDASLKVIRNVRDVGHVSELTTLLR